MKELEIAAEKTGYATALSASWVGFNPDWVDYPIPETLEKAGVLIVDSRLAASSRYADLQKQASGELTLLKLKDYRPQILVSGLYMNAKTPTPQPALELVYVLADEDLQLEMFKVSGRLPTSNEPLKSVVKENSMAAAVFSQATNGLLAFPDLAASK